MALLRREELVEMTKSFTIACIDRGSSSFMEIILSMILEISCQNWKLSYNSYPIESYAGISIYSAGTKQFR